MRPYAEIEKGLQENPGFTCDSITKLMYIKDLGIDGPPKTAEELKERIKGYFNFCRTNEMRPGIESLSLALSISRKTFWTWTNGARGEEFKNICVSAKQIICSFLEIGLLENKINAPGAIFALKNVAGWTDTMQIETNVTKENELTAAELPVFDIMSEELLPTFENSAEEIEFKRSDMPTFESEV